MAVKYVSFSTAISRYRQLFHNTITAKTNSKYTSTVCTGRTFPTICSTLSIPMIYAAKVSVLKTLSFPVSTYLAVNVSSPSLPIKNDKNRDINTARACCSSVTSSNCTAYMPCIKYVTDASPMSGYRPWVAMYSGTWPSRDTSSHPCTVRAIVAEYFSDNAAWLGISRF